LLLSLARLDASEGIRVEILTVKNEANGQAGAIAAAVLVFAACTCRAQKKYCSSKEQRRRRGPCDGSYRLSFNDEAAKADWLEGLLLTRGGIPQKLSPAP
jgi:hypothetical protein